MRDLGLHLIDTVYMLNKHQFLLGEDKQTQSVVWS